MGGGQAGLATGYYLRRLGINPLILDNQTAPGGSWRHVWPSMTLFSSSGFSNLPGMPMPEYAGFPPPSHVISYLAAYESRYNLRVHRPITVTAATYDGAFHLKTTDPTYTCRHLIVATGKKPFVPYYPGTTSAQQLHSSYYRGPKRLRGTKVAVVGGANSGAQIASELALDSNITVTWYTRHEPRWMPDDVDGRVLFQRNRARALSISRGEPDPGPATDIGDIVMLPAVREARNSGALTWTPMFSSLDDVSADYLIWATGFRPAVGPFRNLDSDLFSFVGFDQLNGPGAGTLMGVGPYAKLAAQRAAK